MKDFAIGSTAQTNHRHGRKGEKVKIYVLRIVCRSRYLVCQLTQWRLDLVLIRPDDSPVASLPMALQENNWRTDVISKFRRNPFKFFHARQCGVRMVIRRRQRPSGSGLLYQIPLPQPDMLCRSIAFLWCLMMLLLDIWSTRPLYFAGFDMAWM